MINNGSYILLGSKTIASNAQFGHPHFKRADFADHNLIKSVALSPKNGTPMNALPKTSNGMIEEASHNYRLPAGSPNQSEIKPFIPNPLNHSSSNFNFGPRANERQRPSLNLTAFEHKEANDSKEQENLIKEAHEKIESLTLIVMSNQKRIAELEQSWGNGSLPQNQSNTEAVSNSEIPTGTPLNADIIHSLLGRHSKSWKEQIKNTQSEMGELREMITADFSKSNDKQWERLQSSADDNKNSDSVVTGYEENLHKKVERIHNELEEKINQNSELISELSASLERELQMLSVRQENYQSSGIKCSGSAILLRFAESFRVRRNIGKSLKNGQIKITLTDNTYYIDHQGYMLDKDQFYIIDGKGNQVRLEDRHVRMLKEQKILM